MKSVCLIKENSISVSARVVWEEEEEETVTPLGIGVVAVLPILFLPHSSLRECMMRVREDMVNLPQRLCWALYYEEEEEDSWRDLDVTRSLPASCCTSSSSSSTSNAHSSPAGCG